MLAAPVTDKRIAPVRWGILGTAKIALEKVIPAMRGSSLSQVVAIASRDIAKAREVAKRLEIPRAYGSYQELIDDHDIEAIYNPLPNHLHVPWSIRAAEQGKHVLCEKPIALNAQEARVLLEARDRTGVQIGEAFMVRTHPQWLKVKEIVDSGRIGDLRLVAGHFSYYERDPGDIRSRVEWGGGALMDVGCYPITISRWLFGAEPTEVVGLVERDPEMQVDRLTSGLLRFEGGQATFSCSTQLVAYQTTEIFGTRGRIAASFHANPQIESRIVVDDGSDLLGGGGSETTTFPPVNQYTIQADRFSEAIRGVGSVPVSLEDAVGNMAVIDALFRSAESRRWERPGF